MLKNNTLIIVLVIILVIVFFGGFGMMNSFGGHYGGVFGLGGLFAVIALIAAIWVIYDVLANNKGLSDGMKVLWVVCAIFFSIVTAIIYYIVGRNNKNDLFRKNRKYYRS